MKIKCVFYIYLSILTILGLSRSAMYLLTNNQSAMLLLQLSNMAPAPLVFVNQSFFLKKTLTLKYRDNAVVTYKIDESAEWLIKKRILYNVIMYGHDLTNEDWNVFAEYFFCGKSMRLKLSEARQTSIVSLDLNYLEKNTNELVMRRSHICKAI